MSEFLSSNPGEKLNMFAFLRSRECRKRVSIPFSVTRHLKLMLCLRSRHSARRSYLLIGTEQSQVIVAMNYQSYYHFTGATVYHYKALNPKIIIIIIVRSYQAQTSIGPMRPWQARKEKNQKIKPRKTIRTQLQKGVTYFLGSGEIRYCSAEVTFYWGKSLSL